jgi:hypothetical protein
MQLGNENLLNRLQEIFELTHQIERFLIMSRWFNLLVASEGFAIFVAFIMGNYVISIQRQLGANFLTLLLTTVLFCLSPALLAIYLVKFYHTVWQWYMKLESVKGDMAWELRPPAKA